MITSNNFSFSAKSTEVAFCIVVYKEYFYETVAFTTLLTSLKEIEKLKVWQIFIYDNTDVKDWNINYENQLGDVAIYYYHNPINPGISVAYNHVSKAAKENGCEWILFFDQDTQLPPHTIANYVLAIEEHPEVLVKVPILIAGGKIISPFRQILKRSFIIRSIQPGRYKVNKFKFINSGLLVNLDIFLSVGGYNEQIKLDFTDLTFEQKIQNEISYYQVLPIQLQHSFSFHNTDINKALKRYTIFIEDLRNCPRLNFCDHLGYRLVDFLHLLSLSIKYKSLAFIKLRFTGRNILDLS